MIPNSNPVVPTIMPVNPDSPQPGGQSPAQSSPTLAEALHAMGARTALEAGHAEAMLFAHYRALVTRSQAVSYFGVVPSGGSLAATCAGISTP